MLIYDKTEIRDALSLEDIFELLSEFFGEPEMINNQYIVSKTICHNHPNDSASRKLYYYNNSKLFKCYTGCENSTFDIFELTIKVMDIQHKQEFDLNAAVRWVAFRFGMSGREEDAPDDDALEDWKYLSNYARIQDVEVNNTELLTLKEFDTKILRRLNYNVELTPWLNEGITQQALDHAIIGFYPGGDQITIPHFDKDGRFVGLRGRTLCEEEADLYGKYRPIRINKLLYNHPLGMNLYNLNNSKHNIALMKKAIIFESEKSCLKYQSYFGIENDISVACCGSSISAYQIQLLLDLGVQEIIIAFDRQFKEIGDTEFQHLKKNLLKIRDKYKNFVTISFIFDKKMITGYKSSPVDEGKEKFLQLFKERIVL